MLAGLDERFGDVLAHSAASLKGGIVNIAVMSLGEGTE
jgi:hypothetical protein